tara:strand:- start:595 stop:810 length:216 start_codon:yes stop_codon:yes gene_type:complete
MTTTDQSPPPFPPGNAMPFLDARYDRIIANLTRRLALRPPPPRPRGEPIHDFFVLSFFQAEEPADDTSAAL